MRIALKQFMQASDSKLSELRYMDKRGSAAAAESVGISRSGFTGAGYFVSGALLTAPGTWRGIGPLPTCSATVRTCTFTVRSKPQLQHIPSFTS